MSWNRPHPLFADLAAPPPPLVFIDDQEAANVAQIDIAWAQDFERVHVLVSDLAPATQAVELWLRTSSDGGATFDAGASDYRFIATAFDAGAGGLAINGADHISLTDDFNDLGSDGAYLVTLRRPSDAGLLTAVQSVGGLERAVGGVIVSRSHGHRDSAGLVNAARFFMQTGNISTGRFFAWGETS